MAENEAKAGTPSGTPPTEEQERVNRRRVREAGRFDDHTVKVPNPAVISSAQQVFERID